MKSFWLAEASYGGIPWYAKGFDGNTLLGTTNAWEAKRFETEAGCRDWINSWYVMESEKGKYTPVQHGFVEEDRK